MCIVCFVLQGFATLNTWMVHFCNHQADVTFFVRMIVDIQKDDPHSAVQEQVAHMCSLFTSDPKTYAKLRQDSEFTVTNSHQSGHGGPQHEVCSSSSQ